MSEILENSIEETEILDADFLENPPELPPLPRLKGEPIDFSGVPQVAYDLQTQFVPLRIVGVRFGEFGRVHDFDAETHSMKVGDAVVADLPEKGIMLGWVAKAPLMIDNSEVKLRLPRLMRRATEEDLEKFAKIQQAEQKGLENTRSQVQRFGLAMDVLRVEYTLDMRKAIVYFSSENRVDFRNLLKELVHDLKARVELRQVGVRDQAKMRGGIGPCGEELCCSRHLNKFHAVNIKMAKDQNLSLKPTRVSGLCGRLKCCLQYEEDAYRELLRGTPEVGRRIKCSKGCGTVADVDVLRQFVMVQFDDGLYARVDVKDIVSPATAKGDRSYKNEKMVATTDVDSLVDQIREVAQSDEQEDLVSDDLD